MATKIEGRNVLIVDDHRDIREMIRFSLQMMGCSVVEAADGREAVEMASHIQPDLILMDLSMPVMDGYKATQEIHKLPQLHEVPVVAVSAYCDAYNRQKALAAGCVDCVGKPVDFQLIDGILKKHLVAH